MVMKNSNGCQKFLGTDTKNLHMEKLRLAIVYRHAKFRDDRRPHVGNVNSYSSEIYAKKSLPVFEISNFENFHKITLLSS